MTRENPQWTPEELARMRQMPATGVDPYRKLPPMARKRGIAIFANRANMAYADVEILLGDILHDSPRAESAARTLAMAIGGERHNRPLEHQGAFCPGGRRGRPGFCAVSVRGEDR
jgi:hypothetical protein